MLSEYHTLVISGVIRLIVGCFILFGVLPRLVFPPLLSGEPWRRRVAGFLVAGAFVLVVVHLLVLGSMYDGLVFVTVCVGMWTVKVWRGRAGGTRQDLPQLAAGLLRKVDGASWDAFLGAVRQRVKDLAGRMSMSDTTIIALLTAVIAMSGIIRLVPVWNHAAPFSVEYYEILQHAKQLQLNRMYEEGYSVPLGLAVIAQTLSLISQVNIAIVLHFLGAVSSMMLSGAIAFVVYRATRSLHGAVLGAALFGVFNHLLPMDPRHQVEADGLVLASAFALPALSFLVEFFAEPSRRLLLIAIAGLVAAAAINLFIGFVTLGGMLLIAAAALMYAYRLPWLRGRKLLATIAATILFLGGFLLFLLLGLDRENFRNVLDVLLYDKHLNRYFAMPDGLSPLVTNCSAVFFGLMILSGAWRYDRTSMGLQLSTWGTFGVAIFLLARFSGGDIWILQFSQVAFVLSVLLAVACGSLFGVFVRLGVGVLDRFSVRGVGRHIGEAGALVAALAVLCVYSPARPVVFEYSAEPDGFASSIYLIEQQYTPYQWTVVSHLGTALVGMNRGRFMDYDYFCKQYDPTTYTQGAKGAVPTPVVFFFVERLHERTEIATELMTVNRNAEEGMKQWLEEYEKHHHDLRVFYSDKNVVVYELKDPTINALRG